MRVVLAGAAALALILTAAIAGCAPARDADALFRDMASEDGEAQQDAAAELDALVRRGDSSVFERGAHSATPMVRIHSILYLARIDTPAAHAALRGLLAVDERVLLPFNPIRMKPSSERTDSRVLVANLVGLHGGDPGAVEELTRAVDERRPVDVLTGTCLALGALRDPGGLAFLGRMIGYDDVQVVRAAVQALGRIKDDGVVPLLRAAAAHPEPQVRSDVLSALGSRDDAGSLAIVRSLAVSDPERDIRLGAIRQASVDRSAAGIEFLIGLLAKADAETRATILEVLGRLTGQSLGPRPEAWTRWLERNRDRFPAQGSGR
jgi:HEAT repeat protein